jgi:hypothetical protein
MSAIDKFLNQQWETDEPSGDLGTWKHINEFKYRYEAAAFTCNHDDHSTCVSILQSMGFNKDEIDKLVEWLKGNGGFCDCEVGLNVLRRHC